MHSEVSRRRRVLVRYFRILKTQSRELSIGDFFCLVGKWAFLNETIFVYKRNINLCSFKIEDRISGVEIRKGSLADLEKAMMIMKPCPWEFQCHVYDGIEDFFVAIDASGIQHISWIYSHDKRNRLLKLGEKEAEIKFCLTMPSQRGRGIYTLVLQTIGRFLATKGIERIFICVEKRNLASIRGIQKAGFECVGEVKLRKVLGVQVSPLWNTSEGR